MPVFRIGDTVETETATVLVENNREVFIPIGTHVFQLIVVDDAGNESVPAMLKFVVRDATNPTAILTGPSQVEPGQVFELNGARSSDVPPGKIVRFRWTLLE